MEWSRLKIKINENSHTIYILSKKLQNVNEPFGLKLNKIDGQENEWEFSSEVKREFPHQICDIYILN